MKAEDDPNHIEIRIDRRNILGMVITVTKCVRRGFKGTMLTFRFYGEGHDV
jgi:hypothetical protein